MCKFLFRYRLVLEEGWVRSEMWLLGQLLFLTLSPDQSSIEHSSACFIFNHINEMSTASHLLSQMSNLITLLYKLEGGLWRPSVDAFVTSTACCDFDLWPLETNQVFCMFHRHCSSLIDRVKISCPTRHKIGHFWRRSSQQISWHCTKKLNQTQQQQIYIQKKICWNTKETKKAKPGLVASYYLWTGSWMGLFWKQ